MLFLFALLPVCLAGSATVQSQIDTDSVIQSIKQYSTPGAWDKRHYAAVKRTLGMSVNGTVPTAK